MMDALLTPIILDSQDVQSGASKLLRGELQGLAIDANYPGNGQGSITIKDLLTSTNLRSNIGLNDARSPLVNSGTSPKMIEISPAVTTWTAHNLAIRSEELDNAAWSTAKFNLSVAANNATDPNGTITAETFTDDATDALHLFRDIVAFPAAAEGAFSIYAKAGTHSHFIINYSSATTVEIFITQVFDLSDGTLGETDVGTTSGTISSASIESVGNGWYRCTLVGSISHANGDLGYGFAENKSSNTFGNSGHPTYAGSSETLHLWGAQLNRGSVATAYIPTTTTASGLQVGPHSYEWSPHNLVLQSEDFDTTWTKARATVSTNAIAAPDGTLTADKIVEDGTATNTHYVNTGTIFPSGDTTTITVRAKKGERSWLWFGITTGSSQPYAFFDLDTGVVGTTGSSGGTITTTSSIEALGGGWYLCTMTTAVAAGNLYVMGMATADNTFTYSGDSSSGLYLWGAQLNKGPQPTAYMPTTTAAVYGTAISYDLANSKYGILVEPAATNLQVYSQEFDNAAWTKSLSVINANATTAPDGTTTADRLIDDGGTGNGAVYVEDGLTVATSTTYTVSIYAKADQLNWMTMRLVSFTTPGSSNAGFDLANGVVGTADAGFDSITIEDVGDGWRRCSGTFTTDASDTTGSVRFYAAQTDRDLAVPRDGTSSIFLWQAQAELGTVATSPIPTYASTVTRAVDVVTFETTTFPYSDTAGSWIMDVEITINTTGNQRILDKGTNGIFAYDGNNNGSLRMYDSTTATTAIEGVFTNGSSTKISASWSGVVAKQNYSGVASISMDYDGVWGDGTTIEIGKNAGNKLLPMRISTLTFVPRAYTEAELIAKTV